MEGYQDAMGMGCEVYDEYPDDCGIFDYANSMFPATMACCQCGGGNTSDDGDGWVYIGEYSLPGDNAEEVVDEVFGWYTEHDMNVTGWTLETLKAYAEMQDYDGFIVLPWLNLTAFKSEETAGVPVELEFADFEGDGRQFWARV